LLLLRHYTSTYEPQELKFVGRVQTEVGLSKKNLSNIIDQLSFLFAVRILLAQNAASRHVGGQVPRSTK
jgi:hypothetical protein